MEATTKDLRLHTKSLIAATERGEEVIITWRGKPRAKLVPFVESHQPGAEGGLEVRESTRPAYDNAHNPAFGLWRDDEAVGVKKDEGAVDRQVRQWRKPRTF